jgi:voltage-gated potassium channel
LRRPLNYRDHEGHFDDMRLERMLRRIVSRFVDDPASVRNAARLIVGATATAVLAGAVVMRLFDHREYPNMGRALWFTLQTATTVGYGDVTPASAVGRVVGALVMLIAIGFITIVTAAITSTFVEASRRRASEAEESAGTRADNHAGELVAINRRLDQIAETLRVLVDRSHPT